MKACPNCGCTEREDERSITPVWDHGRIRVECRCGLCGPWATKTGRESYAEVVALWNALPRREDADKLHDALGKIVIWAEAYPPDVFPPYSDQSLAELNVLLEARGYSLDALGAQMLRHVVEGVGDIARKAMEGENG